MEPTEVEGRAGRAEPRLGGGHRLCAVRFQPRGLHFVNVNYFSLNAMYRNRLVRTFLGASDLAAKDRNKFDGFAASDNLSVCDLLHKPDAKLFHVINITLNLTGSDNNAWQERKAAPFVCTPLHTGGQLVGYRSSALYCDKISLGTAMSLSGAAVSPNWGYHSSTVTSFVLIFNARLGGWFGNPSYDQAWKTNGPDRSSSRFWQEALGALRRTRSPTSIFPMEAT